MRYTWDDTKRKNNIKKHHLDFADAEIIFEGLTLTIPDNRFDYGEDRFISFGMLDNAIVIIAHTERGDETRIISMRKASKHEEIIYFKSLGN